MSILQKYSASSHITLMMPNAMASPTPIIQVKYHIAFSFKKMRWSVNVVIVGAYCLDRDLSAQHAVHPRSVGQYDGQEHQHHPEHDLQRHMAGYHIPYRQAAARVGTRRHDEGKHRDASSEDHPR